MSNIAEELVRRIAEMERAVDRLKTLDGGPENDPQFALARYRDMVLTLPGLRGFWPMSPVNANGDAFDQSGLGFTLTYNGNPTYNIDGVVPYINLDGTGDYLSRANQAALGISGTETYIASAIRGLTMGGWVRFNDAVGGTSNGIATKDSAGAGGRSYSLFRLATNGFLRFGVSGDGTAFTSVTDGIAMGSNQWHYVVGRYNPATELAAWTYNPTTRELSKATNTTSIPSSIFNSSTAFSIGAFTTGNLLANARFFGMWLCVAHLSDTQIDNLFQVSRVALGV